jgi:HEXXH motif-containing protein
MYCRCLANNHLGQTGLTGTRFDDVKTLVALQVERQAIRFLSLREIALQNRERVPFAMLEILDNVVEAPPAVAAQLFNLPHFPQWCLTLKEFLLFNLTTEGVGERLEIHATELRRLLLSAFMTVTPNEAYNAELIVQPSGSIHLPGTGWMGRFPTEMSGQRISLRVKRNEAPFKHTLDNRIGRAELWSTDLLVRRPGSRSYTFPIEDQQEIERWRHLVEGYTAELVDHWPEFAAELPYLFKGIICVETPAGENHLSGTFSEVPGAIYLSWAESEEVILEAISHELFHTRLNLMIEHESFQPWLASEDMFWAPWRLEIRPPLAFVHGAYANFGMMLYNHWVCRHRPGSNWRAKLSTHLARLAIAQAQWVQAVRLHEFPQVLTTVMDTMLENVKQLWVDAAAGLSDKLLIAVAGETTELQKFKQGGKQIMFGKDIQDVLDGLALDLR